MNHFYAVIMAGGGGTRLWPVSRKASPKQFLKIVGDRSLFQIAVDRLNGLFTPDEIHVVTIAEQMREMQLQVPEIPEKNYLIEPMARGTAAVVAMAAATLKQRDPDAVIAILTADHIITEQHKFKDALLASAELAQKGYLVTLGIQPSHAAIGYGYLVSGASIGSYNGFPAYKVKRYVEKPTHEGAMALLTQEKANWNSGMFIWRADIVLKEIKLLMPKLAAIIEDLAPLLEFDHHATEFSTMWAKISPETIDYGIMEKSHHTAVILAGDLGWSDLGSWDSFFDFLPADENGNIVINARHVSTGTTGSLVMSNSSQQLITTMGLQNLIVVVTQDAVLVCPRGDSQRVKELVRLLKEQDLQQYL